MLDIRVYDRCGISTRVHYTVTSSGPAVQQCGAGVFNISVASAHSLFDQDDLPKAQVKLSNSHHEPLALLAIRVVVP